MATQVEGETESRQLPLSRRADPERPGVRQVRGSGRNGKAVHYVDFGSEEAATAAVQRRRRGLSALLFWKR